MPESTPPIPDELWMLYDLEEDCWVPSIETAGDPWLAFFSAESAIESATHHRNKWGIECKPVRVK